MTSRVFFCSKQRAMRLAQDVLRDMNLNKKDIDNSTNTIYARRNWKFLSPPRDVEIQMFADENKVEIAVNVQAQISALDFGTSEYLEEEFLHRLKERLN
jgi:hypothetical protein